LLFDTLLENFLHDTLFSYAILVASLGQVYKGRLKETGELVAVKVQRPFVLETVTIDLFIIRKLGLILRRFPQVKRELLSKLPFHEEFRFRDMAIEDEYEQPQPSWILYKLKLTMLNTKPFT
jgi:ABC1 atypical kinase-like domain